MDFEYSDVFYVSSEDLHEMYLLCKNGLTPQQALNEVARGWEDEDFYRVGLVKDQIIAEINRRLTQTMYNKNRG